MPADFPVHPNLEGGAPTISTVSSWKFGMSRSYSQLDLTDRLRLYHFVECKAPINEMARRLGRDRSTIYRAIRCNAFQDLQLPEYSRYFPTVADASQRAAAAPEEADSAPELVGPEQRLNH